MSFLSSIGSGIGNFFGNLLGGSSDDEKKKKQQAAAATPSPALAVTQPKQNNAPLAVNSTPPSNGVNLVVPSQQLQKAPLSPAQQRSQAFLDANGGPVDPNYRSKPPSAVDIGVEALKGIGHTLADPAINSYQKLQKANTAVLDQKAAENTGKPGIGRGVAIAASALPEQATNFVKSIGQTGAEYAGYVAPELKGLKVAETAAPLVKAGVGLIKHGATSAPLSVVGSLAAGERDPTTIAQNAAASTLFAGAVPGLSGLKKVPGEVAPGVRSLNPNQAGDAVTAATAEAAQQAEKSRLAQQAELDVPAYKRQGQPEPQVQSPLDIPTFQRNNADELVAAAQNKIANIDETLQKVVPDNSANRFAATQELKQAMARDPQEAAALIRQQLLRKAVGGGDPEAAAAGLAPARESAVTALADARAAQAAREALAGRVAPETVMAPTAPETAAPLEAAAPVPVAAPAPDMPPTPPEAPSTAPTALPEAPPPAPAEAAPPVMPETAAPPSVPAAPLTHDAIVKQMGPAVVGLKGKYSERMPMNVEELKSKAAAVIANMSDEDLLKSFSTTGPDTMINDANSFSVARAALDRLSQMADDPHAVQVVSNILDALDRYVSKSGQGLRIAQEAFDMMPLPMKVRYIVKKIDAANADTKGYQPLKDDPAKAAIVEATITGHLNASQAITEKAAAIEGQLNQIAEVVKNGQPAPANPRPLAAELKGLKRDLAANNGELVKYYSDLVPGRTKGQKALVDFPRQMMLSSGTARINDLVTTGANVAQLSLQNVAQGLLAKAVNAFSPGRVTDTLKGGSKLFTGAAEELKKTAGEVQGKQYTNDLAGSLKTNIEQRSGLQKARGAIGRTIQASTEAATNASAGVRDQRLYQLADQEAARAGLKGAARSDYAEARAAVPSRQMQEAADRLHMEINNLQDNPVTRSLNRVAAAIQGDTAIGGFLKNQVVPFTSWLGGNIHNTLTDKNVVASFVKTMDSARKGDAEGVVQNLAKLANNAVQTYALGYLLTKSGVITNTNAEGYNDAGAYFHIGDRYIPVGLAGFFAPNIILGNAAYHGLNSGGNNPGDRIGKFAGDAILNLAKSVNVAGALGADNNLTRSYDALTAPGGSAGDAGATLAAGAAGQFIPSATGDLNAVLNNNTSLNPTHEKADTKVVNPSSATGTAKDVPKSAVASLVNRVPVASQLALPRKADVAASDVLDRVSKGDRETPGGAVTKAAAQTAAAVSKDFAARGVPDPNAKYKDGNSFEKAVQARFEDGNYDAAIEGLTAKLNAEKSNKDMPKSSLKSLQDQIALYKVHKSGKFDPGLVDRYKGTTLAEWRNMGDPESDTYNLEMYQKLYAYDSALAKAGISKSPLDKAENAYTAKKDKATGRNSAGGRALARIKSNTIGNTPSLAKVSLGDLSPQKAGSIKIPTIQQVKAGELIKKRTISVGKA